VFFWLLGFPGAPGKNLSECRQASSIPSSFFFCPLVVKNLSKFFFVSFAGNFTGIQAGKQIPLSFICRLLARRPVYLSLLRFSFGSGLFLRGLLFLLGPGGQPFAALENAQGYFLLPPFFQPKNRTFFHNSKVSFRVS